MSAFAEGFSSCLESTIDLYAARQPHSLSFLLVHSFTNAKLRMTELEPEVDGLIGCDFWPVEHGNGRNTNVQHSLELAASSKRVSDTQ
jgi:hypothetical protein